MYDTGVVASACQVRTKKQSTLPWKMLFYNSNYDKLLIVENEKYRKKLSVCKYVAAVLTYKIDVKSVSLKSSTMNQLVITSLTIILC